MAGLFTDRYRIYTRKTDPDSCLSYLHITLRLSVAICLPATFLLFFFGLTDIASGLVIGVLGGLAKSYLMVRALLEARSPNGSLFGRLGLVFASFCAAALISEHALIAAGAGLLVVHCLFIADQVKNQETGVTG